jgi:transposase
MIDQQTIFEIHRLKNRRLSNRKVAGMLGINKDTVAKYFTNPQATCGPRKKRVSKLDDYKERIDEIIKECPDISATVILRELQSAGFTGEVSLIRRYLKKVRTKIKTRQPYVRFESEPGRQMQVDWGHFGSLCYGDVNRKLYALAVIESYSRKLYVEFTHSQKQDTLHQCLFNAFCYFGGTPSELVVDNMTTAVIERSAKVIRFNDAFLKFLLPYKISPRACNVRAPFEKGKIERSIQYLRRNFFPLRSFKNLDDTQGQVLQWLDDIANRRIHQTTGQTPQQRASNLQLRPLSEGVTDIYKEVLTVQVYKDFCVRFDSNAYTVPPWCIGKQLTLKADQKTIQLFSGSRLIATHLRCWEKKKRIEIPSHVEKAMKKQRRFLESKQTALFKALGDEFREYLDGLVQSNQPIKKSIARLLSLKDQYGSGSLSWAILKALRYGAFGADYIENILYQEMTPETDHPPVQMKNEALNRIHLSEPSLEEYDALILKRK